MIYHIHMATCGILNCNEPLFERFYCHVCKLNMCATCADNLVIDGKQICPKCTFGGNFEGIFPGISNVRFSQDHATSILSTHQGLYKALEDNPQPIYKYTVFMTRKRNNLILVFRLNDGQGERFMQFSLFIKNKLVMIQFFCPLNISGQDIEQELILEETFNPDKKNPVFSSLTKKFKIDVFDYFQTLSTKKRFDTEPIFGVEWWKLMMGWYEENKDYIQFFRSRRRGSKSVQRRRKLGSKSKSRKRSSKPRRR
jgi:hypothetical protein